MEEVQVLTLEERSGQIKKEPLVRLSSTVMLS